MARTIYEIAMSLSGDAEVVNSLSNLSQALDQSGQRLMQIGGRLTAFTDAAKSAAADYDEGLKKVLTVLPAASGSIQEFDAALRKQVESQGNAIDLTSAAAASYELFSAGASDTEAAMVALAAATDVSRGGFTDATTAVDALTSVYNTYAETLGDEATPASEKYRIIADQIIQVQNKGKIVAGEYAHNIGRLAPAASAAGIKFEEMNAAIAQITAKGVPAEATFAGLVQVISNIQKPTSQAGELISKVNKELAAMGESQIDFSGAALSKMGLAGFVEQLTLINKTSVDLKTNLGTLFESSEARAALLPLLQDVDGFKGSLDAMSSSAGAAAKASDIMAESFNNRAAEAANKLNTAMIDMGKGVLVATAPIVEALAFLVDNFNKLPDSFKTAIAIVATMTGGAIALGGAILIATSSVQGLVLAYGQLTAAAGAASAAITANTTANAAATASGITLQTALTGAWQRLTGAAASAAPAIASAGVATAAAGTAATTAAPAIAGASAATAGAGAAAGGAVVSLSAMIAPLANVALKFAVVGAAMWAFQQIYETFKDGGSETKKSTDSLKESIEELGGTAEKAKSGVDSLGNAVKGANDSMKDPAPQGWTDSIADFLGLTTRAEKRAWDYSKAVDELTSVNTDAMIAARGLAAEIEKTGANPQNLEKAAKAIEVLDKAIENVDKELSGLSEKELGTEVYQKVKGQLEAQKEALEKNKAALEEKVKSHQADTKATEASGKATQKLTKDMEQLRKEEEEYLKTSAKSTEAAQAKLDLEQKRVELARKTGKLTQAQADQKTAEIAEKLFLNDKDRIEKEIASDKTLDETKDKLRSELVQKETDLEEKRLQAWKSAQEEKLDKIRHYQQLELNEIQLLAATKGATEEEL